MTWPLGSALALGFLLGLRHAFDADHLVAVSTLAPAERRLPRAASIGLAWSLGHTLTIATVSCLVLGLEWSVGERLALVFEFAVAILIVFLGGRLLVGALVGALIHIHPHTHGHRAHSHIHLHGRGIAHDHQHAGWPCTRMGASHHLALLIGMAHGLAGSGALTLLLATTLDGLLDGLVFLSLFGVGSTVGMVATSLLLAVPFRWAAHRSGRLLGAAQALLALAGIGFGVRLALRLLDAAW